MMAGRGSFPFSMGPSHHASSPTPLRAGTFFCPGSRWRTSLMRAHPLFSSADEPRLFTVSEIRPGPREFGRAVTSSYMQTFAARVPGATFIGAPMICWASATLHNVPALNSGIDDHAGAAAVEELDMDPPAGGDR